MAIKEQSERNDPLLISMSIKIRENRGLDNALYIKITCMSCNHLLYRLRNPNISNPKIQLVNHARSFNLLDFCLISAHTRLQYIGFVLMAYGPSIGGPQTPPMLIITDPQAAKFNNASILSETRIYSRVMFTVWPQWAHRRWFSGPSAVIMTHVTLSSKEFNVIPRVT